MRVGHETRWSASFCLVSRQTPRFARKRSSEADMALQRSSRGLQMVASCLTGGNPFRLTSTSVRNNSLPSFVTISLLSSTFSSTLHVNLLDNQINSHRSTLLAQSSTTFENPLLRKQQAIYLHHKQPTIRTRWTGTRVAEIRVEE